jgi:release factor glutamine methyltransferase
LAQAEMSSFRELIRRRLRHEPVAYILGRKGFWTLELAVDPAVLIPRPETERLVEAALAHLSALPPGRTARVLDLGTGSGAIVLALAAAAPGHRYFASDISAAALATARRNAAAGLEGRVFFFAADWLAALRPAGGRFDLIVSNPPYIARGGLSGLPPEVVRSEPRLALDGGEDGLGAHRTLIAGAGYHLVPGGLLLLEIGDGQRASVTALAEAAGHYDAARCLPDLSGRERVLASTKKNIADC